MFISAFLQIMEPKMKFQGKYRIESIRAQWWDYSSNGAYFITICTKDRKHFFGEVRQGKMMLSEIGRIARQCWDEIPDHFPFVRLGAFVVMPDHVHGILFIEKDEVEAQEGFVACNESTTPKNQVMSQKSPKKGSLPSVIRSYKSAVSNFSRKSNPQFSWQSLYYDRIIFDPEAIERISKYIEDNPKNWGLKKEGRLRIQ